MPQRPLIDQVWEAGVVGAGGAGFPTWKKIDAKVDTVIANGAECEPLLRNDQAVMARYPTEIVAGLESVMNFTGAKRGVIALKKHYRQATRKLEAAISKKKQISLYFLPEVYPAGDEFVLVYEVTGKVIPAGGLPLQIGSLVSNVETFLNIKRAIDGTPVTHRFITITGAVDSPKTMRVPVGTSIKQVLDLAGGPTISQWRVVSGGPMMGTVLDKIDTPITKTTSSIIVLPVQHPVIRRKLRDLTYDLRQIQSVCCGCNYCTLVCPRSLLGHNFKPHLVMRSLALGFPPKEATISHAAACCNCDLCGVFACPMGLSIGRLNKKITGIMKKEGISPIDQPPNPQPRTLRPYSMVPVKRLTSRLQLDSYDHPLPHDENDYYPPRVTLPLSQHIGQPASPLVKKGQEVKQGQMIAEVPRGTMGACLHASISGKIEKITKTSISIIA